VALVSEAGTPNIADPGAYFITQIRALGYEIVPIPGASAVTCLLSVSGMLANQFTFQGFFPKKESEAQQCLTQLRPLNIPILYYEAANRLLKTMQLIAAFDANAQVFVGKELTKMFETFWSGNIQDVLVQLAQANLKGEWCFVLKLSEVEQAQNLSEIVSNLKKIGLTNKQIIAVGTKFLNLSKNELYKEAIS
jgi:16S rRNA (cytidine1402-2'-O)-methyltransferase